MGGQVKGAARLQQRGFGETVRRLLVKSTAGPRQGPHRGRAIAFHEQGRRAPGGVQLLPAASFRWEGTGDTRTLRLSPAKDRTGFSVIRVIVSDGTMRETNTFSASVYPQLGMVLSEAFSYPDGPLIVPSRSWSFHAPDAPNPTNLLVRGERLILSGGNAEDAHRLLDCGLQKVDSGTVFYAGFTVKVTQLPSSGGDFFAHFRDDKSGFRGRVHLASGSASTGHFRFGLSSGSEAPVFMSSESALGEDHRLVLRYEVSTAACSLWLDPADEASTSIRATVEGSTISASNWAFRQAAGIGGMEVDDLAISSRFPDVAHVATAPRLLVERVADSLVLRWPILPGFALQHAQQIEVVSAAWTDVLTSPTHESGMARVALPITGSANFFRLLQK